MRTYLALVAIACTAAFICGYELGGIVWAVTLISPTATVFTVVSTVRTVLAAR